MTSEEKRRVAAKADKYIARDGGAPKDRWQSMSHMERARRVATQQQWDVLGYLDDPPTRSREQAREAFRKILEEIKIMTA